MQHWLMKTEPEAFSIDDLRRKKVEPWDGVRNFQARNYMQAMAVGDLVLFYHTGREPGVAGLAKVAKLAHPDQSQFDKKSPYFDPRASREKPYWHCVDARFVKKFSTIIPLRQLRADKALKGMLLLRPGSRLSVMPVSREHFAHIERLAR